MIICGFLVLEACKVTILHSFYTCAPKAVWKKNQEVWSSTQGVKGDSHMRFCKIISMIISHSFSSPLSSSLYWWSSSSTSFLMMIELWDKTYSEATSSATLADFCSPCCSEKKENSRTMIVAMKLLRIMFGHKTKHLTNGNIDNLCHGSRLL